MDEAGSVQDPIQRAVEDALRACGILILDGKDGNLPHHDNSGILLQDSENGSIPHDDSRGIVLQDGDDNSLYHHDNSGIFLQESEDGLSHHDNEDEGQGYSSSDQDHCMDEDSLDEDCNETSRGSPCGAVDASPVVDNGGQADLLYTHLEQSPFPFLKLHRMRVPERVIVKEEEIQVKTEVMYQVIEVERPELVTVGVQDKTRSCSAKKGGTLTRKKRVPSMTKDIQYLLRCKVCNKGYWHPEQLMKHMKIFHPTEKIAVKRAKKVKQSHVCQQCGRGCPSNAHLKEHLRRHAKDHPLRCGVCNQGFWRKCKLMAHTKRYHPAKEIGAQCTESQVGHNQVNGLAFTKDSSLSANVHEAATVALDKEATEAMNSESVHTRQQTKIDSNKTEDHMREHDIHTVYPLRCKVCNKGYKFLGRLNLHMKSFHPTEKIEEKRANYINQSHICDKCNKEYESLGRLNEHLRRHANDYAVRCKVCNKGYWRKCNLIAHTKRYHAGEKKDEQWSEEKQRDTAQPRQGHQERPAEVNRTKTRTQLHPCQRCDKKFPTEGRLREHLLTHNIQYLLRCKVCNKGYRLAEQLIKHMKKFHPKEKIEVKRKRVKGIKQSHICDKCSKEFDSVAQLKVHLKKHGKVHPLRCRVCNQGFWRKCQLLIHTKRYHPAKEIGAQCTESQVGHSQVNGLAFIKDSSLSANVHEAATVALDKEATEAMNSESVHTLQQTQIDSDKNTNTGEQPNTNEWHLMQHMETCHLVEKEQVPVNEKIQLMNKEAGGEEKQGDNAQTREEHEDRPTKEKQNKGRLQSYNCERCDQEFPTKDLMREHLTTHDIHTVYPLRCKVCNKGYRILGRLNLHMARFHPTEKIEEKRAKDINQSHICDKCNKEYESIGRLNEHLRRHAKDYSVRCRVCNKGYWRKADLIAHTKRHHAGEAKDEPHVGHEASHLTDKLVEKTQSMENGAAEEKQGDTAQTRQGHQERPAEGQQRETRTQLHSCQRCDKKFLTEGQLREHLLTHNIQYLMRCKVCNKGYRRPEELIKHMKKFHPKEKIEVKRAEVVEQSHICPKCDKEYESLGRLNEHLRRHAKDYSLRCRVCNKGYWRKCNLIAHTKRHHAGEENDEPHVGHENAKADRRRRLYSCERCDKEFLTSVHLMEHSISHNVEYLSRCKVCNKGYRQVELLSKHMEASHPKVNVAGKTPQTTDKILNPNEPAVDEEEGGAFVCEACGNAFNCHTRLARHLLTHAGETLYKCGWCMVGFRYSWALVLHIAECENNRQIQSDEDQGIATVIHDSRHTNSTDDARKEQCVARAAKVASKVTSDISMDLSDVRDMKLATKRYSNGSKPDNLCEMANSLEGTNVTSCGSTLDVPIPKDIAGTTENHSDGSKPGAAAEDPEGSSDTFEQTDTTSDDQSPVDVKDPSESRMTAKVTKVDTANYHPKLRTTPTTMLKSNDHKLAKMKGPPYVCDECGKPVSCENDLHRHLNVHVKQKVFKCLVCKGSFLKEQELVQHLDKHIADSEELPQETLPRQNSSKCHFNTVYKCGVCNKGFLRSEQAYTHMDEHVAIAAIDSEQTDEANIQAIRMTPIFGNNQTCVLTKTCWKRKKEPLIGVKCGLCGEEFDSRRSFQKHSCTDTDKMCSICGQTCSTSRACELHLKSHFNIRRKKRFHCSPCNRSFNLKPGLVAHNDRWHCDSPRYICHICGKGLWTYRRHKAHVLMHTGEKKAPFKCKSCYKSFVKEITLRRHTLQHHTEDSKFQCGTCGKVLKNAWSLRSHAKVHTGEKPFDCRVCSQAFARQNHLDVHMRRHTGEKPHKCAICDKAFAQQAGLSGHMKTHEKEKKKKQGPDQTLLQ